MQDSNTTAAIDAALRCDWQVAINANGKILKENPTDIDCLNRLGKAYLETGDCKKAALFFHKVLKIDKYNPIAAKNLIRTTDMKSVKKTKIKNSFPNLSTVNFLEEPGKTRLVALVNIAPPSILLKQDHADSLVLIPKHHTVVVEDSDGNYLGALPDDLGHRLSILIKGGNQYEAIVKSVSRNSFVIFLRETLRSKKFHNTPSFLATNSTDYLSFVREEAGNAEDPKAALASDLDESAEGQDEEPSASSKLHQDEEPETP